MSFLLVVRGGRNEKGVMLLLPRLTPSVPAFSLCLHQWSSLPWATVAYGWCQCILQLQQELKAQDRLHTHLDLLQNASWCRQRFLPGVRRGKAEHRAREGLWMHSQCPCWFQCRSLWSASLSRWHSKVRLFPRFTQELNLLVLVKFI